MKKIKFAIYLIFNLSYKDGNYAKNDTPQFNSILAVFCFEFFILLFSISLFEKFTNISLFDAFESLCPTKLGRVLFFFTLLIPPNYYFFIKKKYFDRIYMEFKDAAMNTKRNRKIGYICLLLYLPIMLLIRKYWL